MKEWLVTAGTWLLPFLGIVTVYLLWQVGSGLEVISRQLEDIKANVNEICAVVEDMRRPEDEESNREEA